MFCKKCGKSIKDNAVFCSYCGGQIRKNEDPLKTGWKPSGLTSSFLTEKEQGQSKIEHFANRLKEEDKKKLLGIICLGIIVLLFICIIVFVIGKGEKGKNSEKDYLVTGEWSSQDLSNLGSIMGEAVGGLKGDAVALAIGDALGEATITFSDAGNLYVSFHNVSVTIGSFTYELISDSRMRLAYEIEIPVLGNTVTLSYNADYKVNKNTMTLDFFGQKITLDRK